MCSSIPTVPAALYVYKDQNYVYYTVQVRNSYVLIESCHNSVAIGMETSSTHVLGCRGKYLYSSTEQKRFIGKLSWNFGNHNIILILF